MLSRISFAKKDIPSFITGKKKETCYQIDGDYNFDLKKFIWEEFYQSDQQLDEDVEKVHMYISSMNFWRDNGEEYVKELRLFKKIINFDRVDEYDISNSLDRWIKILF